MLQLCPYVAWGSRATLTCSPPLAGLVEQEQGRPRATTDAAPKRPAPPEALLAQPPRPSPAVTASANRVSEQLRAQEERQQRVRSKLDAIRNMCIPCRIADVRLHHKGENVRPCRAKQHGRCLRCLHPGHGVTTCPLPTSATNACHVCWLPGPMHPKGGDGFGLTTCPHEAFKLVLLAGKAYDVLRRRDLAAMTLHAFHAYCTNPSNSVEVMDAFLSLV